MGPADCKLFFYLYLVVRDSFLLIMLRLDLFIMRMHIKKVKSYIIYTYTEED